MAYRVVTTAWDEDETWGATLLTELAHQEAEGFTLSAMTPRTVAIHPAPSGPTHYAVVLVLVFHGEEA